MNNPDIVPGIYDIPAEQYHADPVPGGSLSSTGARTLLKAPAKFAHDRDAGPPPQTDAMEFGTAAHAIVLGDGPNIVCVDYDSWRSKPAQAERAEIRAAGAVPLLPAEYDRAHAMAAAVRRHPRAAELLAVGEAEQTFIWRDEATGVWCRSRVDWLPPLGPDGLTIADYKTCSDASDEAIQQAVYRWAYHQQADWYQAGALEVLRVEAKFEFIFQEKDAPYLVNTVQLPLDALQLGAARNRRAREVYAECTRTGEWPGYSETTRYLSLPPWAADRDAREYLS
ncbi:PD-(D/E)XK nuclease-like domain-containing protein [Streptomyces sp. MP131-18]|uniref:PD-(D/E)XK nuclease-like domain-containing protein n=1 Tax=Streptomyces sp. MP131-18 TaxID=1857892 RepID=UPI0009C86A59|nr:PD-(D/E)XK nuclease-like domain-containing protein [Streptomyces sp. MP131-18]ONK09501.1 Exodeoxyribonuclease 8 [Streptomyces sp. MP131-18]